MTRLVFDWYSAKPGAAAVTLSKSCVALGGRQFTRRDIELVGADLDVCLRVGPQIVHPRRV